MHTYTCVHKHTHTHTHTHALTYRYTADGELKYLVAGRDLIRPERNTLTVSYLDIEEHSTKLANVIQEHYYQ